MSKHRLSYVLAATSFLCVIVSVGCETNNIEREHIFYPFTTGSHAPFSPGQRRFVIWSNYPAATNTITGSVLERGHTVVERARLEEVFNEQKIRLTHTSDDKASLLRVGKLLGADRLILAEIIITPDQNTAVSNISVAVRSIDVETGEIRWAGTATMPRPIRNAEAMIPTLVQAAMYRAICQIEEGYAWTEYGPGVKPGCSKK